MAKSTLFSFNWNDRFEGTYALGPLTAKEAAQKMLASTPTWMKALMRLRNRVVRIFGLRTVDIALGGVNGFPILSCTERQVVLGFDDSHLDFRIVVDTLGSSTGEIVGVTTLVNRKNLLGYIYIFCVGPFHRLIVPTLLKGFCTNVRFVDGSTQSARVSL